MKRLASLLVLSALLAPFCAIAEWEAEPGSKVQLKVEEALTAFRSRVPRTQDYFAQAFAYAIYPSVTRIGFGFGGAYGRGIVIQGDDTIGTTKYKQVTSGIQAGARNFSMILFFEDKQALEYFQSSKTQFMGQAGIAIAKAGVAGTPAYGDGVAVVTLTRFGLMGEFTVSGAKFTFEPITEN